MATISITASADADIYGYSTNYTTSRTTAAGFISPYLTAGQQKSGLFPANYLVRRGFLKFDTSALAGSVINQVNLSLAVVTNGSTVDFDVQIVKHDWSGQDPVDSGNMDAAYDAALAGAEDSSIWRNTSGIATNTPYVSGNLDTSWVNVSGPTYYSLRSSRDKSGTAPTTSEYVFFHPSNAATEAYRPTLIIDYTPPQPAPARRTMTVEAERRTMAVEAENRTMAVEE